MIGERRRDEGRKYRRERAKWRGGRGGEEVKHVIQWKMNDIIVP